MILPLGRSTLFPALAGFRKGLAQQPVHRFIEGVLILHMGAHYPRSGQGVNFKIQLPLQ